MSGLDLSLVCFALEKLYTDVIATFATDGLNVPNVFGWKEPARRDNRIDGCRIVWVPGDDQTDELGSIEAPSQPGGNPRNLAQLNELVTVYIEAVDDADPSELAQYRATRGLFDAWHRAVYLSGVGRVLAGRTTWVNTQVELRDGAAIRALLEVQAPLQDVATGSVTGAAAELVNSLLDEDEPLSVPAS